MYFNHFGTIEKLNKNANRKANNYLLYNNIVITHISVCFKKWKKKMMIKMYKSNDKSMSNKSKTIKIDSQKNEIIMIIWLNINMIQRVLKSHESAV